MFNRAQHKSSQVSQLPTIFISQSAVARDRPNRGREALREAEGLVRECYRKSRTPSSVASACLLKIPNPLRRGWSHGPPLNSGGEKTSSYEMISFDLPAVEPIARKTIARESL